MSEKDERYEHGQESRESYLALTRIPADEKNIEALEAAVSDQLRMLEAAKMPRAVQWFENAAMLLGNHMTRFYYSPTGGLGYKVYGTDINTNPMDALLAKSADNRLIRPVETVTGLLTDNLPQPRVKPNSESPDDEDAAEIAALLVDLVFERPLYMPRKLRKAILLTMICGTSAAEIEYGPTDQPIAIPRTKIVRKKNPAYDPDGPEDEVFNSKEIDVKEQDEDDVQMREDIQGRVWSMFHITTDPGAEDEDSLKWVARHSFEDIDWVADNFVSRSKDDGYIYTDEAALCASLGSMDATRHPLYWWSKLQDLIESPQYAWSSGALTSTLSRSETGALPNQCRFTVIDCKPNREFPRGRTLYFANERLVAVHKVNGREQARAWSQKYADRWHNYAFFHWFKMPGRFNGVALLSQLVPLQKKINAIDALVQANRQYISIGQWLIPKQSRMKPGQLSGLPGEQYEYTATGTGVKPEKVHNLPLPAELLQERAELIAAIDHIAATGLVGSQVSASAARAGNMLEMLRREKLQSKASMIQMFTEALELCGQNVLLEYQLNMTQEDPELTKRIRAAAADLSDYAVQSFVAASLRDHHAVKLDVASQLRNSPEAKEQHAIEYLQAAGASSTPQDRDAVMRALGLDEFARSEESAAIRKARRVVGRVMAGMVQFAQLDAEQRPMIAMPDVDNATAMVPVFQRALLSDRFLSLESERQAALVTLFDYYKQQAAMEAQQRMQQMMLMAQMGAGPAAS